MLGQAHLDALTAGPPTSSIPGVSTSTNFTPSSAGDSMVAMSQGWDERTVVVPWIAPVLKTFLPQRAFRTEDLPRLTMPKAAISIVPVSSLSEPPLVTCDAVPPQHRAGARTNRRVHAYPAP